MAVFDKRGIRGGIIISIILVTVIGMIFGVEDIFTTALVSQSVPEFVHVTQFPSQIFSIPSFSDTIFMQLDISSALTVGMVSTILTLLFVDFMDTAGTLTSVANLSGRVDQDGKVDGIEKAVLADSVATAVGALAGTTNTTSYIESGAGIKEGGRTGLTAVTVGILFLLCIFLAPLAKSVPYYASAPALVFIATYFMRNIIDIDWDDVSEYAPAVLAAVVMPFTFSIANGIAVGFLAYLVIKVLSGKLNELNSGTIFIGLISVPYFYSVTLF
jgi:AGZA family xanthine/uracil permease-like MFS transporter